MASYNYAFYSLEVHIKIMCIKNDVVLDLMKYGLFGLGQQIFL